MLRQASVVAHCTVISILMMTLMLLSEMVSAFDGERRGFILGFGAGVGNLWIQQDSDYHSEALNYDEQSIFTDFKIGGSFERDAFYYSNKVFHLSSDEYMLLSSISGIGWTHWFAEKRGSTLSATAGLSSYGISPLDSDFADWEGDAATYGFGFTIGGGYEFSRYWLVEGCAYYSLNQSSDEWDDRQTIGLALTINVLGY